MKVAGIALAENFLLNVVVPAGNAAQVSGPAMVVATERDKTTPGIRPSGAGRWVVACKRGACRPEAGIAGSETGIGQGRARIVGPPCPCIATMAVLAARPRAARAG